MSLIFKLVLTALLSLFVVFPAETAAAVRCEALFKLHSTFLQEKASAVKFDELKQFVIDEKIMSVVDFRRLEDRILPFNLSSKDMGNAMFYAVFDFVSVRPSPKLDLLVNRYLRPVFIQYLNEFVAFAQTEVGKKRVEIELLFGLEKLYLPDTDGKVFVWSAKNSQKFIARLNSEFYRKNNFNLIVANQLLVQLAYLHSVLSHSENLTSADLARASDAYLSSLTLGHVFIPAVGMWNTTNSNAQWFLGTTVNMLPPSLNHKINAHGPLSLIDGLAHDHGHYYELRLKTIGRLLNVEVNINNKKRLEKLDEKLHELFLVTLHEIKTENNAAISGTVLTNVISFFLHQTDVLEQFVNRLKDRRLDWGPNSMETVTTARIMREQLELHQNFYHYVGTDFANFEKTARYLISMLGQQANKSDFQRHLPNSP